MSNYQNTDILIDGKYFNMYYYEKFNDYYSLSAVSVERQTKKWFLEQLKETDVVYDIGAHIGMYTILFSQRTNNVVAFEPTETYDNLLVPNLKRNNILTPKLEKIALGVRSGLLKDKIFRIWGDEPEELEYNFMTLDDYISKSSLKPNYLKIDVDSYDYEVLLGGKEYLSSNNVTVCVEVSEESLSYRNHQKQDVSMFMFNLGYKLMHVFDGENLIFQK